MARGLRAAALAAGLAAPALVAPGGGSAAQTPAPAAAFSDCGACPGMVVVPAGEFVMGSPESEAGRDPDEGLRRLAVYEADGTSKEEDEKRAA